MSGIENRESATATPAEERPVYLAIVGSRDYPNLDRVRRFVESLPSNTIVVSGGARGVDRCAATAARARGLRVIEFLAEWRRLGRSAGFVRNEKIVRQCDRMVAFWDGSSPGTRNSISLARRSGRPVDIHP